MIQPDEIIVIFLHTYNFQKGLRSDRNFVRLYSDLSASEVLHGAKKVNHAQRQQLVEAIKLAKAFAVIEKGPHRRSWGRPIPMSQTSFSYQGWFQENWALWSGSREHFRIQGTKDICEKFISDVALPSPEEPLSMCIKPHKKPALKVFNEAIFSTVKVNPDCDAVKTSCSAWYSPLQALASSSRTTNSATSIRHAIEQVSFIYAI